MRAVTIRDTTNAILARLIFQGWAALVGRMFKVGALEARRFTAVLMFRATASHYPSEYCYPMVQSALSPRKRGVRVVSRPPPRSAVRSGRRRRARVLLQRGGDGPRHVRAERLEAERRERPDVVHDARRFHGEWGRTAPWSCCSAGGACAPCAGHEGRASLRPASCRRRSTAAGAVASDCGGGSGGGGVRSASSPYARLSRPWLSRTDCERFGRGVVRLQA
jgi:hypothetical protein